MKGMSTSVADTCDTAYNPQMGILNLFGHKLFDPEAFEKELSALSTKISTVKNQTTRLSRRRIALRKAIYLYASLFYVLVVIYRYSTALSGCTRLISRMLLLRSFLTCLRTSDWGFIFLFPLVVSALAYIIDMIFGYTKRYNERTVASLIRKHRQKLEELKEVTNYTKTNQLVQKFSSNNMDLDSANINEINGPSSSANGLNSNKLGQERNINTHSGSYSSVSANQVADPQAGRSQNPEKQPFTDNQRNFLQHELGSQSQSSRDPTLIRARKNILDTPATLGQIDSSRAHENWPPSVDTTRSVQDRILDFIIGSDHNESVESRYALICSTCFTHNGLAPPACVEPLNVKYICRSCGYFNGQHLLRQESQNRGEEEVSQGVSLGHGLDSFQQEGETPENEEPEQGKQEQGAETQILQCKESQKEENEQDEKENLESKKGENSKDEGGETASTLEI